MNAKNTIWTWRFITGLVLLALAPILASQNSDNSPLGDLARKTRQEKQSKDHRAAQKVLDDENPPVGKKGESQSGTYCRTLPCAQLFVFIRSGSTCKTPAECRSTKKSVVQTFFGPQINGEDLEYAEQRYVRGMLSAPWRLGVVPQITYDEETSVDGRPAMVAHFTFTRDRIEYMGRALLVAAPEQVMTAACVFKKVDFDNGSGICEDMINSAETRIPDEYKVYEPPAYTKQYGNGYDDQ